MAARGLRVASAFDYNKQLADDLLTLTLVRHHMTPPNPQHNGGHGKGTW